MKVYLVEGYDLEADMRFSDRIFKKKKKANKYARRRNLDYSDDYPVAYMVKEFKVH